MKSIVFALLLTFTMGLLACNNQSKETTVEETETIEHVDKTGKEYTSEYICPMHCKGSGSDSPGECPVCGMDYVLNEEMDHSGHDHDHDHDHDHEH